MVGPAPLCTTIGTLADRFSAMGGLAEGTFGIRSDTLALDERLADCCFGYSLGYFGFV